MIYGTTIFFVSAFIHTEAVVVQYRQDKVVS